jgi:hypothetical protein
MVVHLGGSVCRLEQWMETLWLRTRKPIERFNDSAD